MVWVIQPMTEIYQSERAREVIPASLSSVLEQTWSSVARSFPSPLDTAAIRSFGNFSAITTIAPALSTLITLAHDNTQGAQEHDIVRARSRLFIGYVLSENA